MRRIKRKDEGISRYRTGWDEDGKADSPDSAADTLSSAASTRPDLNKADLNEPDLNEEDANWGSCAASHSFNITTDYSRNG